MPSIEKGTGGSIPAVLAAKSCHDDGSCLLRRLEHVRFYAQFPGGFRVVRPVVKKQRPSRLAAQGIEADAINLRVRLDDPQLAGPDLDLELVQPAEFLL